MNVELFFLLKHPELEDCLDATLYIALGRQPCQDRIKIGRLPSS